jgi:glycosyltransferase involved in cell wall biosynthesis
VPRVSVIMPAYNAAMYIAEALQSVKAQTYGDWEVVVADDGSTDDTGAIAASFEDRVRIVRSDRNRGLASARNLAIEHARGELLALLDSDDRWLPEYLQSQLAAYDDASASQRRVGLVTCNALLLEEGHVAHETYADRFGVADDVTVATLLRGNPIFISALIPKAVVDEVGGFAPELRSCEDLDLWLRILEAGYRVVRNPGTLVVYRLGPQQLSAQRAYMAHASQVVYRRALERGRLNPRQRRQARRAMRLQRAVQELDAFRSGGDGPLPARSARLARSLPLFALVAVENTVRWIRVVVTRRRASRSMAAEPTDMKRRSADIRR